MRTDCSDKENGYEKEFEFINKFICKPKHYDDDYSIKESFLKLKLMEFSTSILVITAMGSALLARAIEHDESYATKSLLRHLKLFAFSITTICVFLSSKIYNLL